MTTKTKPKRKRYPYNTAEPCTPAEAAASCEASPVTIGELEVLDVLGAEGTLVKAPSYMRLVHTIRQQHQTIEGIDSLVAAAEQHICSRPGGILPGETESRCGICGALAALERASEKNT